MRLRAGQPAGLLTVGAYGVGKTHIAYAFLNQAVTEGLLKPGEILVGSEDDLLGQIATASFSDRARLRNRLINRRWRAVLVDDVGWAKYPRPDDAWALWHDFLDFMWTRRRIVILTTNLSPREQRPKAGGRNGETETVNRLREWVGEAAYDRLAAMIGGNIINLGADENHRRANSTALETAWERSQETLRAAARGDTNVSTAGGHQSSSPADLSPAVTTSPLPPDHDPDPFGEQESLL
jgi:DNA replication protein DnaC